MKKKNYHPVSPSKPRWLRSTGFSHRKKKTRCKKKIKREKREKENKKKGEKDLRERKGKEDLYT